MHQLHLLVCEVIHSHLYLFYRHILNKYITSFISIIISNYAFTKWVSVNPWQKQWVIKRRLVFLQLDMIHWCVSKIEHLINHCFPTVRFGSLFQCDIVLSPFSQKSHIVITYSVHDAVISTMDHAEWSVLCSYGF